GCAVSTVLALVLWPVHAYRPARLAIASCYRELAALAAKIAGLAEDREQAWSALVLIQPPRVRAELERARVALGAVRRARPAVQLAIRVATALRSGAPLEDDVLAPETQMPRTTVRAALAPDSALLRHAARMAVTVSIGAAIAAWMGVSRASWVTVAVVIVLQP